jgi:hypothetical protein
MESPIVDVKGEPGLDGGRRQAWPEVVLDPDHGKDPASRGQAWKPFLGMRLSGGERKAPPIPRFVVI